MPAETLSSGNGSVMGGANRSAAILAAPARAGSPRYEGKTDPLRLQRSLSAARLTPSVGAKSGLTIRRAIVIYALRKIMRYLFHFLDKIEPALANRPVFLFLDYDGTVTPIRKKPALGRISKRSKKLLAELSKSSHCRLAIISGRSLKDVRKMVGVSGIIYSGNHGLEMRGPQIRFQSPVSKKHKAILRQLHRRLVGKLSPIKGVLIEDKGLSLSVHYRLAAAKDRPLVKTVFRQITSVYTERKQIRVKPGKMVLEIFPPVEWNKGKAVQWLLKNAAVNNTRIMPIYIGDDVTDEDVFRILKHRGLSIYVGKPGKSRARYYVKNTDEVHDFLSLIAKLK
jgi:trehalose-phosphatase